MPPIIFSAFVVFGFQQAKPAYNGTWILNSEKSRTAISQGLVPIRGRITITVTDKEMIIINQTLPKDDEVKLSPQQLAETKPYAASAPSRPRILAPCDRSCAPRSGKAMH